MTTLQARRFAFFAGMLTILAAEGGRWLITPQPDASGARQAAVIAQIIVAAGLALWCWRRSARAVGGGIPRDLGAAI